MALLPWLEQPLAQALRQQRGHALLISGPAGVGQFELALALALAWLCEAPDTVPLDAAGQGAATAKQGACGICAACRLNAAHSHPDLLVLLPEALRTPLGWAGADDGEPTSSKAKPSKEIKVEAVRGAVGFAQGTGARGRSKVVLIHPAERMNGIAAHALLKTLEEPPGITRFILSSAAPDALLPTIRSRCQSVPLPLPDPLLALPWLRAQGVDEPAVLLAATGGQVQQVIEWKEQGIDAAKWTTLPQHLARGEIGPLGGWTLPQILEVLQKVCHDAACRAAGAEPRYFPAKAFERLPRADAATGLRSLGHWSRELDRIARHIEHPFSAPLMVDALIARAQSALTTRLCASTVQAEIAQDQLTGTPRGGRRPISSAG